MGRQNIFHTLSVTSIMPPSTIEDLLQFLLANRSLVLPKEKKADLFKSRWSGQSIVADLFHRLQVMGKDDYYSLIRFPSKTTSLREVIDLTFIPFDLKQLGEAVPSHNDALKVVGELDGKMVINVTDLVKANGDLANIPQFQNRVVRDFLSRNFYNSQGNSWVSPNLVRYVAKVYSMTLGGQIARLFGLSPLVQSFVQTVFCAFFVAKMTSDEVTPAFLKAHGKAMNLPDQADLNQILSFFDDVLHHAVPHSLEEVCQVIDAYDHDQLKINGVSRLNRPVLNMRFSNWYPDSHLAVIALEYPPYFLFLILQVLSNIPIGLSYHMKSMNLLREGKDLLEQLLKTPSFLAL